MKLDPLLRNWVPHFVLVITALGTLAATYFVSSSSEAKDSLRFQSTVRQVQDSIQNRLETYVALLRAGTGFFAGSGRVNKSQFQAFIGRLELQRRYPGIQGIGFSARVRPEHRQALVQFMRSQGVSDFEIKPDYDRPDYYPIIYLEPMDRRNQVAIGYDMFTEETRREAMERARDTGLPAMSGKVQLVQEIDEEKQAGFLIYAPVYEGGIVPATEAERREKLTGFVYSPFRADDLLRGILGSDTLPRTDFQVFDGDSLSAEKLLHDSLHARKSGADSYEARLTATTSIEVAGRSWNLVFFSRPEFELGSGRSFVPYVLIGGLMLSLVLFAVTRSQVKARAAAESAAQQMRLSQEAVRMSEARFRTLVEQSPLSIQILSPEGRILQVNRAWEELWGVTLDQIPEYNLLEDEQLIAKGVMPYIKRAFEGEPTAIPPVLYDPNETIPDRTSHEDSKRWTRAVIYPLKDEAGNVREVVLIHEDITKSKEVEEERMEILAREQKARHEAEAANRLKDEFLATISHELRTPLTSMLGWARMLRTGKLDEQAATRAIETIERNAKLQAQIINDLLDVSRIITGKLHLNVEPVSLSAIIQAAIDSVRLAADAKAIRLETVISSTPEIILGDSNRLQQVVWNLLSNAIKFTPQGGSVQVRLEYLGEPGSSNGSSRQARIIVSDTGQGITADFLPFVFDRFRQADSSYTRLHGGLGLGLSIVRHMVELHGGTVEARSGGEGQGATFIVTLPLAGSPLAELMLRNQQQGAQSASQEEQAAKLYRPPRLNGLRVLVVDDEHDTREMLGAMLAQYGVEVIEASSAGEALARCKQSAPDLLISDIGMPGGDGYELIRKVRSLEGGASLPAIALTAFARDEDRKRAIAAGFHAHLAKPIEPSELIRTICKLVEQDAKL